ncbi:signal transduction histidine kinase [Inhella inkyongensis]|uniref:histidine kinase n=1 Tax=Inhella inkyongensis TaxID=392593 RepID=A0A840SB04_9BURK|nr:ATP-binding protein [Inhella inkyongensis]MBB5205651.1 signal transduction histidine kinase [Inhella inkyongensis]
MSYSRRLMLAFWALALLICALFSLFAMAFAYTVEDRFLDRQLAQEAARLQAGRDATGQWPPPSAPQYRLLLQARELPDGVADQLAAEPGRREFAGSQGRHYHLLKLEEAWLLAEVSDWLVVRPQREGLLTWLALWALGATLLALALGAWLARRMAGPLERLVQRLQQGRPEQLPQGLAQGLAQDELGTLARTLDALHARTQAFIAREQAFTRDVSHELRTPLAVLKMGLDPQQTRLCAATAALEQTLDTLLLLAREDLPQPVEPTALLPLVEQWAIDTLPTDDTDVALQVDLQAGDRLALPPEVLRLVLANLLGNACAHGLGRVRVSFEAGVLCIRNPSAALPAGLGQAFVKGEGSAGFGLGLSIVRRLLERHGAQLDIGHEAGETEVRVSLGGSANPVQPAFAREPAGS